jgi:hypothetical protein
VEELVRLDGNEDVEVARRGPSFLIALAPIVLVILFNFLFTRIFIPMWDTAYLAEPDPGGADGAGALDLLAADAGIGVVILVGDGLGGPLAGLFGENLAFIGELARRDHIKGRDLADRQLHAAAKRKLP